MEPHPVDRLIRDVAETGRRVTDAELRQIREHIAEAGFDPQASERARGVLAGTIWRGRAVRGSDMLPAADVHYLRHVIRKEEWPRGTALNDYLDSIRQIIIDAATGVFVSRYGGAVQIGFLRRSGAVRGPDGVAWVLVEYRVSLGHWVTAFQLEFEAVHGPQRSDLRWLTEPK